MSGSGHGSVGKAAEAVRIWLLGGFRVSIGSSPIEKSAWRLRKAAALVKLLSLARGHRMHREQVMDLLWPDLGTKAASNNLRHTLHAARKILDQKAGSRYLASEEESLVLCPEGSLWVDVVAFEEAALGARRSRSTSAYRAALDLYAGELLPEDRYEEWTEGRRESLRQLYLALLLELATLYEERDEYAQAIEALRKATASEPTLEEAHAGLMRLHALSGRPEQALAQYERLRDVLSRQLDSEPGATTRRLRDEVAAGRFPPAPSGTPQEEELPGTGSHNLPAPRTSFVGREREMVEAKRTLAMTRLLTLTGAGGSGKTRLAVEVARDLVGSYPDGVWLVELAPLSEGELVAQEVAGALEVSERPGEPLTDTLLDALGHKDLLLVVDNCEHVVEAAAQLVDTLLDSCPRLRVLATSREPLGVPGEVLWQVSPLSLPHTDGELTGAAGFESLMRFEAVRLFVERARLRLPDFRLTKENAGAVARVCRRLEGIPLAIELATARMGALAVEQVAQRLDASLGLLSSASRTAEPRQRTLRATLDWSYDLLSEDEQAFFGRLSVFAGGWTLEAAEAVCEGHTIERDEVLDLLGALVDKSLVMAGTAAGGAVRYRMLEPIRQYAREKLEDSGEAAEVQSRHAAFFLALAEEAEPKLSRPEQRLWVERLEAEHDNMREALSWALERGEADLGLRFGGAIWRFWHARGYSSEGIRWLEGALAGGTSASVTARVKALEAMGWLAEFQGDFGRAEPAYEEMLELSRELGHKGNTATALNSLAVMAAARGDNERARVLLDENMAVLQELDERDPSTVLKKYHVLNLMGHLALLAESDYERTTALWEESLELAREAGNILSEGMTLGNLAYAAVLQGDNERATALSEEALALARGLGRAGASIIPEALVNRGLAALGLGNHDRAMASFEEALVMSQNQELRMTISNAVEAMASLAAAHGEATRAARLWGIAQASREVTGIALPSGDWTLHEPYLAAARSRLEDVEWEEALDEGRAMSLEEAVEYALSREKGDRPTPTVADEPPSGEPKLTHREQEVAVLLARGFTNRRISTQLGISERTAGNHVASILRKLGLRSRAQVAGWVAERRLPASHPD